MPNRPPRFDDAFNRDAAEPVKGEDIDHHLARLLTVPSFTFLISWAEKDTRVSRLPTGSDIEKLREAVGAERWVDKLVDRVRAIEERLDRSGDHNGDRQ